MRSRIGMADYIQGPGSGGRTVQQGWRSRWTRRNVTAAALLVYASTFLWMTAAFAGTAKPRAGRRGRSPTPARWPAWSCSRSPRGAGAVVGLAALVPYGIGASSTGVSGPGLNSAIHIAGSGAVLLVVLIPALERRLQRWLSGGAAPEAVTRHG